MRLPVRSSLESLKLRPNGPSAKSITCAEMLGTVQEFFLETFRFKKPGLTLLHPAICIRYCIQRRVHRKMAAALIYGFF